MAAGKKAAGKKAVKKTTKKKTAPEKKKNGKYNVLMVSSEMAPLIKTGGLADVVGVLPAVMREMGHDVRVVIPKYADLKLDGYVVKEKVNPMGVWMGGKEEWCSVFEIETKTGIPVYLIEHHEFFSRDGLYHDAQMNDYIDNPLRFAFLSRAALQLCKDVNFKPDIVHAHDWQASLTPAYLKIWHWDDPMLADAASMLTIHNAQYQGNYPGIHYGYLGLGMQNFTPDKFERFGGLSFLKGGIHYADVVNTVSPGYAREISAPYNDTGIAPYLTNKGENFFGILNGVDYDEWSPEKDKHLPKTYSVNKLDGKKECKLRLQREFLLEEDPDIPIIGAIGRFVEQKGYQLAVGAIGDILNSMQVQFVILGSGDPGLQKYFGELPVAFPGKAGSYIGFSNELAHRIEAGADMFLMPSLFEPCGLNQLYSLKYGTLPIVRATGGLDDTVENYDEGSGEGTGFKFWDATKEALYYTVGWAVSTYYDRREHFEAMRKRAMQRSFSWEKSALEYEKAYAKAIENKKEYDSFFQ